MTSPFTPNLEKKKCDRRGGQWFWLWFFTCNNTGYNIKLYFMACRWRVSRSMGECTIDWRNKMHQRQDHHFYLHDHNLQLHDHHLHLHDHHPYDHHLHLYDAGNSYQIYLPWKFPILHWWGYQYNHCDADGDVDADHQMSKDNSEASERHGGVFILLCPLLLSR